MINFRRLIQRQDAAFIRDERGSISVMTALTFVVLCGLLGLGLDVAVWYAHARRIQSMAEVTALSAAHILSSSGQTTSTVTSVARNNALLNGFDTTSDTISVSFGPSNSIPPNATAVTVAVTRSVPLMFSALFLSSRPIASATATASIKGGAVCIYVLASGSQTLLVNGGFTMKAPDCEIDVASTASTAAIFNSGSTLNVQKTCIGGTVTNNGGVVGGLQTHCSTHPNPFRGTLPQPTVGGCTVNGANYSGSITLNPGTYCGGFNFNGSGTLTLKPGTYVFNGTNWNINSGWTVAGSGVTLYFVNGSSYVQLNSGVNVSLTAPTSGTYANILIFEPDGLSTSGFTINAQSTFGHALQGLVYLPSRNLTLNSNYAGSADAFTLVINTLILNNNSPGKWNITPVSTAKGGISLTN